MPRKTRLQKINHKPTAYGYTRISHPDGFAKGDSCNSQLDRIDAYYKLRLKDKDIQWGGIENDGTSISAYKINFASRPAGRKLTALLKPGDHLIVDKIDRLTRSLHDFTNLMVALDKKGITVHVVGGFDGPITGDSMFGKIAIQLFVMLAEMESSMKSERIKESLTVLKKKGRAWSNGLQYGIKTIEDTDEYGRPIKRFEWCEKERAVMAKVVELIDDRKLNYEEAAPILEDFECKVYGRARRSEKEIIASSKKRWRVMYSRETSIRYLNLTHPSQMPTPKAMLEAARQYRRVRTNKRGKTAPLPYRSEIPEITPEELFSW